MATREPPLDPRLGPSAPAEGGVRPVVALPRSGPSGLVLAIIALVAALILFSLLDARRRALTAPSVTPRAADAARAPAPAAPLYVPREVPPPTMVTVTPAPAPASPPPSSASAPAPPPRIVYVPQPAPARLPPPPALPRVGAEPALVIDTTQARSAPGATATVGEGAAGATMTAEPRSRAGLFANRSTTVPQGTLIPAVLETAFDSTRPGFARAIVSRDIRGFDGTRILIPRGSRLVGEYRSETAPGQKRALVNWTRLIRPDGATIAIGSPAGDPLGRGGVKADVNSHFFERFASAILQSALNVGVNLASRPGSGAVVLALPGTLQNGAGPITPPAQVVPTLTVPQGASISIFVARDLDFTGVEAKR